MDMPFKRFEVISLIVRLSLVSAATFVTIKWLMTYLDPTSKSKKEAKKKAIAQLKRFVPQKFHCYITYKL